MATNNIPTPDPGVGWKGVSFPFRFTQTGGMATSTTADNLSAHIVESLRQIWGTNKYEREMRPEFYGNLDRLPFEPQVAPAGEAALAQYLLSAATKRWEGRVTIRRLEIISVVDETLVLAVEYEVIATRQVYEEELILKR
jgi:phage baseplate assembly protein W